MSNVIDLFDKTGRINAKKCLQGRVDELEEDDDFTDVLVLTYGADGMSIRTNAGGMAETMLMLDMFKHTLIDFHLWSEEDEYDYE
jgi:hypothetical protein